MLFYFIETLNLIILHVLEYLDVTHADRVDLALVLFLYWARQWIRTRWSFLLELHLFHRGLWLSLLGTESLVHHRFWTVIQVWLLLIVGYVGKVLKVRHSYFALRGRIWLDDRCQIWIQLTRLSLPQHLLLPLMLLPYLCFHDDACSVLLLLNVFEELAGVQAAQLTATYLLWAIYLELFRSKAAQFLGDRYRLMGDACIVTGFECFLLDLSDGNKFVLHHQLSLLWLEQHRPIHLFWLSDRACLLWLIQRQDQVALQEYLWNVLWAAANVS